MELSVDETRSYIESSRVGETTGVILSLLEPNLCDQYFGRSGIHSMQAEYQLTERV